LLSPRERNKTLTALAGAEPVVGAQHPAVQRLQFFLSESSWDAEALNARRLELLLSDPGTAPHDAGVLVIDDTGDRKDGRATAHVAPQYLGSRGKVENGIVAVTSLWADERVYYPLHVRPYEPADRLAGGKKDPAFRTKPRLAVELVDAALDAGVLFRAVVTDCTYGENPTFEGALWAAGLPFVMGLRPSTGTWAPAEDAHTPEEAARRPRWGGPDDPGDWTAVERRFRDGHAETWWAVDLVFAGYGPDRSVRLVVATTDPAALPPLQTRYLTTNLPHPGAPRAAEAPFPPADLAEVVRLYALRNWVEQGYKQAKHELGWADFQVRADRAIRRHWALVCCAFSFCWRAWFAAPPAEAPARAKRGAAERRRLPLLAADAAAGARLAGPVASAQELVARLVEPATAPRAPGAHRRRRRRPAARPLPPCLTKYR
jgi:DDE superfamily endonuclease